MMNFVFVPFPEPGAHPTTSPWVGQVLLYFLGSSFQISSKIVDALTLIGSTFEVDMDRNIIVVGSPYITVVNKNRLVVFTASMITFSG